MTYTYEEVRDASISYFNGDELAAEVFAGKYALQDLEGKYYEKTPEDMHRRLAKEFARIEAKYPNPMSEEEIFDLLKDWSIVPQGSPMSGIGNPFQVQSISNCFVIESCQDSYGGILKTDQEQAQIMKRRGGVGHDISNIRPKGMQAANAARTTDGIAIFMDRFSNTTREVAQNGRRGALMLSISVHHPEIETFINIKRDKKRVTGANISVRVSDEFMKRVVSDEEYEQRWPVDSENPIVKKSVRARLIWDQLMEAAYDSAEPGILFWDQIINESPADCYADVGYRTLSTNPCGELPLPAYDSCRLLLLNLMKFVVNKYTGWAHFDYEKFKVYAYKAQRLMDDMIDLELEMIEKIIKKIESDPETAEVKGPELLLWNKIKKVASDSRRTGLGATALGDTVAALGLGYGSEESQAVVDEIYKTLAVSSYTSSIIMAKERGCFPVFYGPSEANNPFIKRILKQLPEDVKQMYTWYGRRNIANLTTSPAGTVSIETQTTSGCEPAFLLDMKRRKKINSSDKLARVDFTDASGDRWQEYVVYHHGHLEWAKINNMHPELDKNKSPYFGSTANEIRWLDKLKLQAAAQRWIDHSISNTTNIPKESTLDDVRNIYMIGWELGCKGVTIYRDGSRDGVLISNDEKKETREIEGVVEVHAPKRPQVLLCHIYYPKIKGVEHIMIIGLLKGKPYEIFFGETKNLKEDRPLTGRLVKHPKKNGLAVYELEYEGADAETFRYKDIVAILDDANYGAFTRTLSTALRHGVPIQFIVEQLRKDKHSDMFSFSAAVARILSKNYIKDGTKVTSKCVDCGSANIAYQQGCATCLDCGSSKCS